LMTLAEVNAEQVMDKYKKEVAERRAAQQQKLKRKVEDRARPPDELKRAWKGKGYLKNFFSNMADRASIQPNEEIWKVKCWVSACPHSPSSLLTSVSPETEDEGGMHYTEELYQEFLSKVPCKSRSRYYRPSASETTFSHLEASSETASHPTFPAGRVLVPASEMGWGRRGRADNAHSPRTVEGKDGR
jgi:hypothetical protein